MTTSDLGKSKFKSSLGTIEESDIYFYLKHLVGEVLLQQSFLHSLLNTVFSHIHFAIAFWLHLLLHLFRIFFFSVFFWSVVRDIICALTLWYSSPARREIIVFPLIIIIYRTFLSNPCFWLCKTISGHTKIFCMSFFSHDQVQGLWWCEYLH